MLFETLSQPEILLFLLGVGFACGIVFDINNFLFVLCEKKKIVRYILDFLSVVAVFAIFFVLILFVSYGEIRVYQIVVFVLALCLERISIGKIVAKFIVLCYTFCENLLRKICFFFERFSKKDKNDKKVC